MLQKCASQLRSDIRFFTNTKEVHLKPVTSVRLFIDHHKTPCERNFTLVCLHLQMGIHASIHARTPSCTSLQMTTMDWNLRVCWFVTTEVTAYHVEVAQLHHLLSLPSFAPGP